MQPDIDPSLTGHPAVPGTHTPALSGDVLRAYDNYRKEVDAAAGTGAVIYFLNS